MWEHLWGVFFFLLAWKDVVILSENETYEKKIIQENNCKILQYYLFEKRSSDTPIIVCKYFRQDRVWLACLFSTEFRL